MPYQNISAQLSVADLQAIKDAVSTIRAKLPFLVTLTAQERRQLFKMGDKSLGFVQNSLTAARNNPDILPASFNTQEFAKDVALATALTEVDALLSQLASEVDDTLLAVGSEAIGSGTTVYEYVKAAAKTTPGLKSVAAQLGERFRRNPTKTTPQPPQP